MNEISFVDKRRQEWHRLSSLCDDADASIANLSARDFHEFVRVYRRVSRDLAIARTKTANLELIAYLNDLVGRAYGILYRSKRKPFGKTIGDSVLLAAQTGRRCKWFVLASASIFVVSVFATLGLLTANPAAMDDLLSPLEQKNFDGWRDSDFNERDASTSVAMSGFYASNNPRVAIIAGSIAASTFGIGTVKLLWMQGQQMGELIHYLQPAHRVGHLLIWIAPHGVTELSGMVVSGAAGLRFGWALLCPGRRKRGEALRLAGKDGIVLLATSIAMMFMAAPIEGFFSFNPGIPDYVKIAFAALAATAWFLFWTGYRAGEPAPV